MLCFFSVPNRKRPTIVDVAVKAGVSLGTVSRVLNNRHDVDPELQRKVNEAARALSEGVVRSPRDGDMAAVYGFGFPPFRGGPLRYADDLGAARVVEDLERLTERLGLRFTPCEGLLEQARSGGKFYS